MTIIELPKKALTDVEIVVKDGEIRVTGLENDLDLVIPALSNEFQFSYIGPREPVDEWRSTVVMRFSGLQVVRGKGTMK